MKADILRKLEELLGSDDVMAIRQQVRDLRESYNQLTRDDERAQREAWDAETHEENEDFNYITSPEDERFEALLDDFRERVKEHKARVAAEQQANLAAKTALLDRLETLVKEEEHVKKAFESLNEIEEQWKTIGDVPSEAHRELQERHQRLRDDFFYHINIYKELLEYDLSINLKKKEELIELARGLSAIEDLKELEMLARSYQKQWLEIGPSPRENYKEIGDLFFGLIRDAFGRIQAHYDALRETHAENLEKKRALVNQVTEIVSLEITNHGTWMKKTEEVLELQNQWKETGYAPKPESEEVWKAFREACDLFFERKNLFYKARKEENKKVQQVKEQLIERANELKDRTDWKKATEALLKLQEEWKAAGSAGQAEERKLWTRFRAACDHFFTAKKAFFSGMDDRHEANKQEKEGIITEVEGFELTGDRAVDVETLRGFQTRWNSIGHVPKQDMKPLSERFFTALDSKWDALKANKVERAVNNYKDRLVNLKEGGEKDLNRERRLLRDKIDRLKQRVLQYETNLNFFTGPGAEEMKKGVERKIRTANDEIEEIKQKLKLFDQV
jgi:hypothetical protein